jgi:hypothetical protein
MVYKITIRKKQAEKWILMQLNHAKDRKGKTLELEELRQLH